MRPQLERSNAADVYLFGSYRLDMARLRLLKGGEEVRLRPKSFDVLCCLVRRRGQVVSKEELFAQVWPDTAVTEDALVQCIVDIRRALGHEGARLIRTVHRRGYLFDAEVEVVDAEPSPPPTGTVVERVDAIRIVVEADAAEGLARTRQPSPGPNHVVAAATVPAPAATRRLFPRPAVAVAVTGLVVAAMAAVAVIRSLPSAATTTYVAITDFTDAATAPALSPDGRMVAFLRGDQFFVNRNDIWIKQLPDGEPVQLTRDPRPKYGPTFTPDGTQVTYTVLDGQAWDTYTIPVLGGASRLLMRNASGLTSLAGGRLLFTEIRDGMHMGVVTTTASRTDIRDVYWPAHQRGMVHFTYPSPDSRWALLVEMDHQPVWLRCRLVPLDRTSEGRQVGPDGQCTAAGWSPDGRWMYVSVIDNGRSQLWRQGFPEGAPEPLTAGPAEASGLAVAPDGRSLITSIGVRHDVLWLHDRRGDHQVSTEGSVFSIPSAFSTGRLQGWSSVPQFSGDGRHIYYLHRREGSAPGYRLRRTEVATGRTEDLSGEFAVGEFDISRDGTLAVFSTGSGNDVRVWLSPVDRSQRPREILRGPVATPLFGADGEILFRFSDGRFNYLYRVNTDGTGRARAADYPIATLQSAAPDGAWVAAILQEGGSHLVPTGGGRPVRLCGGGCPVHWAPDGRYLYVSPRPDDATTMVAIPVVPGPGVPPVPPGGVRSTADHRGIPGAVVIPHPEIAPGLDPGTYAYVKVTSQWNLYRVPLH